jgi:hypothetical protein
LSLPSSLVSVLKKEAKTQKGYAFVHYSPNVPGILSSLTCTQELHDTVIDDIHIKCDISYKLIKQLMSQHDLEVIALIHKYFPGGIDELKEKAETQTSQQQEQTANNNNSLTVRTNNMNGYGYTSSSKSYHNSYHHRSNSNPKYSSSSPSMFPSFASSANNSHASPSTMIFPSPQSVVYPPPFSPIPFYDYSFFGNHHQYPSSVTASASTPVASGGIMDVVETESIPFSPLSGRLATANLYESSTVKTDSDSESANTNTLSASSRSDHYQQQHHHHGTHSHHNSIYGYEIPTTPTPLYGPFSPCPTTAAAIPWHFMANNVPPMMFPYIYPSGSPSATAPLYFSPFPSPRNATTFYDTNSSSSSSFPNSSSSNN